MCTHVWSRGAGRHRRDRARLLEAAADPAAERGAEQPTTHEVARAAGMDLVRSVTGCRPSAPFGSE
ncbi:hypothetical protein [Streptomyces sp. YU58]|uniref:hypothetical protein n=1 Tax=Streptomyces sp. SX92 TaxID=3158972 RepID=UPI0027B91882|nr:hypothetical protein [Streptomyces coralus]WLW51653.1 hypothetical protein QU709_09850 [Streptomyces coralus]